METSNDRPVSHYLKEWRLKRNLSQLELARAVGTTKSIVSRWEAGNCAITMRMMIKLMDALKIMPNQFFAPPDRPSLDVLARGHDDDKLREAQELLGTFFRVSK